MRTQQTQIPFEELLTRAAAESCRRRRESLPPEEVLQGAHDFSALDRCMTPWLKQLDREHGGKTAAREHGQEAAPRRRSLRTLRRIALVAALLAALLMGVLTVSAELRAYVKEVIVQWGERNMTLQYEVDGHQLTELPEGYGPHYIPEGFVYDEESSFVQQSRMLMEYRSEDGSYIQILARVAENASMMNMDTEHTDLHVIEYGDGDAYFGTFENETGYVMFWVEDGIEHELYISYITGNMPESEVYAIAENIY